MFKQMLGRLSNRIFKSGNAPLFALMSLLALSPLVGTVARAATNCSIAEGEDSSLLKCYQREYSEKMKSNDQRANELTLRAQMLAKQASEADQKKQVVAYLDVLRKINQTLSSSRRLASSGCIRMAAKFQSSSTSAVAAVNCRSGQEVELDKDLRRIELQIEVLTLQQP